MQPEVNMLEQEQNLFDLLNYNPSFDVFQKSSAWFYLINCSLFYKVLLLMFYTIYQFSTVHQNKDYVSINHS